MEYTVQKLGRLAGISTRTLRYYDEIGILKPARINSSGYRIYGKQEVDLLQQILFYRELGISLDSIRNIVLSSSFNGIEALRQHHIKLLEKKEQLEALIVNVEKTIAMSEGRIEMSDKEKFEGFKQKFIAENEEKYGKEIREKYGKETVEKSNNYLKNMSKEDYGKMESLSAQVQETLAEAFKTGDPAGPLGQKVAELHKQWISLCWGNYSKETHAGVAQMYVDDERFTAYYDKGQPGMAVFLRDAIHIYTGMK
ncbi:MAG: MerR family transcriptional regulator [Clostridiaceae bacterium]|nr:MerR family transcriptional regulator [Clostridiaceae bacterium]